MDSVSRAMLAEWGNFYLITGTAAAALTGLQFVVQTLIAANAGRAMPGGDPEGGIGAFGSPTVVHFTLALLLSALMCVPWREYGSPRGTLGVLGAGALVYSAIVLLRARRQRGYVPVVEDWIWHIVLPALAYGAVLVAALLLGGTRELPLFLVAAATALLICVGIHNAWDTVTYLTVSAVRAAVSGTPHAQPPAAPAPAGDGR